MTAIFRRIKDTISTADALRRSGMLHPKVMVTTAQALRSWGPTLSAGASANAVRQPGGLALVDDAGALTFAELDATANRMANVLRARGIGPDSNVALLARNSRWFVAASFAIDRLGATNLLMNTGFAGPQLAGALEREGATLLLHDDEFTAMVDEHAPDADRLILDADSAGDVPALVRAMDDIPVGFPERPGKQVILTSGTTGVPKGASRGGPREGGRGASDALAGVALLERVPFRVGDVHAIPAPMFHSLGNASMLIATQMGQTMVVARRFDPENVLRQIAAHEVRSMTVVPVMLQRILGLPGEVLAAHDCSSLEVVFSSGSALPGSLATMWMDLFDDNLYNMYGSTEVAAATIATPADLRAAPGTAGTPLVGVEVRLYDDQDNVVEAAGVDGRIFVGSGLRFDGYTNGNTKPSIDGLLSSGDLGHWDADGRLFVGGRDDDMIVSGGENLYPREVEDLLADLAEIDEVSVVGVPDDEFGQRLCAFVVLADGAALTEDDVRSHVRANLANFKIPRSVYFLDALPRNATGKVLKRELRDRAAG